METFTVYVVRSGGRDERGNPLPTTTHVIPGCIVAPRLEGEGAPDRSDAVPRGATLFAPYGADIRATDRIRIPESEPLHGEWSVDGEPAHWKNPFTGHEAGTQIALVRSS